MDPHHRPARSFQETSWQVPAALAEQREKGAGAASEKANGDSAVGSVKEKLQEEDANAEVGKPGTVRQGKLSQVVWTVPRAS